MSLPALSEHQEQVLLIQWAKLHAKKYPELELLFAIPNGGDRNARVGKKMKDEGARAGVPDLFLPAARNGRHGLFIELKTPARKPKRAGKGGVSADQEWWIDRLNNQNYAAVVCYGWKEAAAILEGYLI